MNGGNQKALVNDIEPKRTPKDYDPRTREQVISDEVARYLRVREDMNDI